MKLGSKILNRTILKYSIFGAAFGTTFVAAAYGIDLIAPGQGLLSYFLIVKNNPVQAVVASAPFVLGAAFAWVGAKQVNLQKQHEAAREADRSIHFMANHDALTRLPNRTNFAENMSLGLSADVGAGRLSTISFIDLDFFKDLNDRFGHDFGDETLKAVALRLSAAIRAGDIVARFGGDEFVVAQFGFTKHEEIVAATSRVKEAFKLPLRIQGREVVLTASIGTAVSCLHGTTVESLVKSADTAVYVVKARGRNAQLFFDLKFDDERNQRLALEEIVRDAVAKNTFALAYQPLFAFGEKLPKGFEALLRLNDQDGNPVPPNRFIPIAEEIGLIDQIGKWVLLNACMTASTWPHDMQISVNLSVAQFKRHSIVGCVKEALQVSGIKPHRLVLEITESLLMTDTDSILEQLNELKEIGVAIAMDDFGTGYSSLGYMLKFPFDRIKIDRSFVQELASNNANAKTLVNTIISLGHTLNMQVTAEGVETKEQADILMSMNCDDAQGYLYSKPITAINLAAFMMKQFSKSTIDTEVHEVHERVATKSKSQ